MTHIYDRDIWRLVRQIIGTPIRDLIIDYGCGDGWNLAQAMQKMEGERGIGMDLDDDAMSHAQRLFDCQYFQADIRNGHKYRPRLATCNGVLHHLRPSEWSCMLRGYPEWFVAVEPNGDSFPVWLSQRVRVILQRLGVVKFSEVIYPATQYRAAFKQYGYRLLGEFRCVRDYRNIVMQPDWRTPFFILLNAWHFVTGYKNTVVQVYKRKDD